MKKFVVIATILIVVSASILILYFLNVGKDTLNTPIPSKESIETDKPKDITKKESDNKLVDSTLKSYDKKPVSEGGWFFEDTPVLASQQAYIAVPIQFDRQDPPTIVLYSHGSNTLVTTDFNEIFMKDLRAYGEFFTKHNYIFAASAQHGANWGSQEAIDDNENLTQYIRRNYLANEKINLIGFSMGGLPTMNYALSYSSQINKIALLAPTTYPTYWTANRINQIKDIQITLWHGNSDINVPISLSVEFVSIMKQGGIPVEFHKMDGKTHWDLDTELKPEILQFFEN